MMRTVIPITRAPEGAEWILILFFLFIVAAVVIGIVLLVRMVGRGNRRPPQTVQPGMQQTTPSPVAPATQPAAPPVAPGPAVAGPAPGWYHKSEDPPGVEQWWDGTRWTGHTRQGQGPA